MFPLTIVPPTKEAWIILLADKICASEETIKGIRKRKRRKKQMIIWSFFVFKFFVYSFWDGCGVDSLFLYNEKQLTTGDFCKCYARFTVQGHCAVILHCITQNPAAVFVLSALCAVH